MTNKIRKEKCKPLLYDAVKEPISTKGYALLQWDFGIRDGRFARYSIQAPEEVIDQILLWRDAAYGTSK